MKVLVVAQDRSIREAMADRFSQRGREHGCVELAALVDLDAVKQLLQEEQVGIVFSTLQCAGKLTEEAITKAAGLARACEQLDIPLIQLSSARIFDGCDGGPFREEEIPVPLSHEAVLISRLEELVRGACTKYLILRTGVLFGAQGENSLTRLVEGFSLGETMLLPEGGLGSPVYPQDLARVVSALVDQLSCGADVWGTYHYSCSDPTSYFHFAETSLAIASQFMDATGLSLELSDKVELEEHWVSPQLNCQKLMDTFGIKQLPWRASIVPAIKRLLEERAKA